MTDNGYGRCIAILEIIQIKKQDGETFLIITETGKKSIKEKGEDEKIPFEEIKTAKAKITFN